MRIHHVKLPWSAQDMADGYFRGLSGKAEVLVRGQRAPIIGNICMVMFMIDISDLKNVKLMMK